MIYLCEREIGFDAAEIGFPSVLGCRAIVLVTGGGLKADHDELKDIAATLGYTGPVYWASLPTAGSAYVHCVDVGHATCGITARAWSDAVDRVAANKAPYAPGANRAMANGAATAEMYVNVSTAGLAAVYPIKI